MKLRYVFATMLFPAMSFAGVMNGGGGKGVLCQTNTTRTIEVLDLYESKNVFRLQEEARQGKLVNEVQLAINRMDQFFKEPNHPVPPPTPINEDRLLKEIYDLMVFIPAGARLPLTDDATVPVLPTNCQMIQIAVFNDLGLQVDKEYWDILDARNQAALYLHEMLYLSRRDYGATRSDETRKFVGRLFSTTPPLPKLAISEGAGYYDCQAGGMNSTPIFDFIITPIDGDESNPWFASFRQLANVPPLSRVMVRIGANVKGSDQFAGSASLEAELYREVRDFKLSGKKMANGQIEITVQVFDSRTGQTTPESRGYCRWTNRTSSLAN